jgi:hypothetical protein
LPDGRGGRAARRYRAKIPPVLPLCPRRPGLCASVVVRARRAADKLGSPPSAITCPARRSWVALSCPVAGVMCWPAQHRVTVSETFGRLSAEAALGRRLSPPPYLCQIARDRTTATSCREHGGVEAGVAPGDGQDASAAATSKVGAGYCSDAAHAMRRPCRPAPPAAADPVSHASAVPPGVREPPRINPRMGRDADLPRAQVRAVTGVEVVAGLGVTDAPRYPPPSTEHAAGNRGWRL